MSIEKNAASTVFLRSLCAVLLAVGFLGVSAAAESQTDCVTATMPGEAFPLTLDTSVASAKGTDEWNSDVIRISVREPGVLIVSAEGPEVQGSVYAPDPMGGAPDLLDEEGLGSAGRILALAVDPGDYCVRIAPLTGGSGSVRVRADLISLTLPSPE